MFRNLLIAVLCLWTSSTRAEDTIQRQWSRADLTVHIQTLPKVPGSTAEQVRDVALEAMRTWSRHTLLTFTPTDGRADITVIATSLDSPTKQPWGDCPLPWEDKPLVLRLTTDKPWSLLKIRQVVAHETGHAIGLPHSDKPDSLMLAGGPNFTEPQWSFDLPEAIARYGERPPADLRNVIEEYANAAIRERVREGFAKVQRDQSAYVSAPEFVRNTLYQDWLGRDGEPEGVAYWTRRLRGQ